MADIAAGTVRGLSIEMMPDYDSETSEVLAQGITRFTVHRAELVGIALVDSPGLPGFASSTSAPGLPAPRTRSPRRNRDRVRRLVCIG